jgi:hypothetical protein
MKKEQGRNAKKFRTKIRQGQVEVINYDGKEYKDENNERK